MKMWRGQLKHLLPQNGPLDIWSGYWEFIIKISEHTWIIYILMHDPFWTKFSNTTFDFVITSERWLKSGDCIRFLWFAALLMFSNVTFRWFLKLSLFFDMVFQQFLKDGCYALLPFHVPYITVKKRSSSAATCFALMLYSALAFVSSIFTGHQILLFSKVNTFWITPRYVLYPLFLSGRRIALSAPFISNQFCISGKLPGGVHSLAI